MQFPVRPRSRIASGRFDDADNFVSLGELASNDDNVSECEAATPSENPLLLARSEMRECSLYAEQSLSRRTGELSS